MNKAEPEVSKVIFSKLLKNMYGIKVQTDLVSFLEKCAFSDGNAHAKLCSTSELDFCCRMETKSVWRK